MEVLMQCRRCQGLMVEDYYIDMEDDQGTHWLRAWRCMSCGEVIDPGILQRRLVRESKLPGFIEQVTGRRSMRRTHQIVPI
jgi:hypothetical protein